MPQSRHTLIKALEFDKVLDHIKACGRSDATSAFIEGMGPLKTREAIEERYSLLRETMKLLRENNPLPFAPFSDVSDLIERTRPEGAVLDAVELAQFLPFLSNSVSALEQVRDRGDLPSLRSLTLDLTGHPDILRRLELSLDEKGYILDSASALLSDLRRQIRGLEGRIRKTLEEIVRKEDVSVFLQDDFITQRAGRWVIPVRMDSKGMVDGVVHDVSKSGETAFVEPSRVILMVNKLENLVAEARAEEIRILRNICAMIRSAADAMAKEFEAVVYMDALDGIARFSSQHGMEVPRLGSDNSIFLKEGKHPLLLLAAKRSGAGKPVVPLDVSLGREESVMVITGPNAGGKTVAVKTIGLIVLMAISGLPVPADPLTTVPVVSNILVDIGDEQSIEHNLSTFSAHIANLSQIVARSGPRSLVLIDELGTGTDPEEGAAIACAVLEEIKGRGALVFSTTHLMGIKGFAQASDRMVNASMEFDVETLAPLYRLRKGEPGQSRAIEIARQFGLPGSVIERSKEILGSGSVEFDNLIADLHRKRADYEARMAKIEIQEREIYEKEQSIEEAVMQTEVKRRHVMADAYAEAERLIAAVKREMYAVLDEMKRQEKRRARETLRDVEKKQGEILEKKRELTGDDDGAGPLGEVHEGDTVFVKTLGYDARVISVDERQGRARVRTGAMEVEVSSKDLARPKGRSVEVRSREIVIDRSGEKAGSRLNLVGLRADDALSRIEPFLNRASLGGLPEVVIVHGLGEGILLRVVREYIEDHPLVRSFRTGSQSEGGDGVTIVQLK